MNSEPTPIVEMRDIHKNFGAVQALRGIDLTLQHREILGLVGDNAAGKSTLMKILSGAYLPTTGDIYLDGTRAHIHDPEDSRAVGIEMVYQDFALCNNLDVTSNVFLGREIPVGVARRRVAYTHLALTQAVDPQRTSAGLPARPVARKQRKRRVGGRHVEPVHRSFREIRQR